MINLLILISFFFFFLIYLCLCFCLFELLHAQFPYKNILYSEFVKYILIRIKYSDPFESQTTEIRLG